MTQPARTLSGTPSARLYRGGCQCGAVHYEARLDLAAPTHHNDSVWEQRVEPADFKVLIGEDSLRGFQFTAESVHHFFCACCGVRVYLHHMASAQVDFYAIDVRNLHSRRAPSAGWQHVGATPMLRLS